MSSKLCTLILLCGSFIIEASDGVYLSQKEFECLRQITEYLETKYQPGTLKLSFEDCSDALLENIHPEQQLYTDGYFNIFCCIVNYTENVQLTDQQKNGLYNLANAINSQSSRIEKITKVVESYRQDIFNAKTPKLCPSNSTAFKNWLRTLKNQWVTKTKLTNPELLQFSNQINKIECSQNHKIAHQHIITKIKKKLTPPSKKRKIDSIDQENNTHLSNLCDPSQKSLAFNYKAFLNNSDSDNDYIIDGEY